MTELSTYILDIEDAQEKLLELLEEVYCEGDIVIFEDLQDNIKEYLNDDIIYDYEADRILYNYGINAAVEEFEEFFPIETINLHSFSRIIVNTLQTVEISELAGYVMKEEVMPISQIIETVKKLDLSEFDY